MDGRLRNQCNASSSSTIHPPPSLHYSITPPSNRQTCENCIHHPCRSVCRIECLGRRSADRFMVHASFLEIRPPLRDDRGPQLRQRREHLESRHIEPKPARLLR